MITLSAFILYTATFTQDPLSSHTSKTYGKSNQRIGISVFPTIFIIDKGKDSCISKFVGNTKFDNVRRNKRVRKHGQIKWTCKSVAYWGHLNKHLLPHKKLTTRLTETWEILKWRYLKDQMQKWLEVNRYKKVKRLIVSFPLKGTGMNCSENALW